MKAVRVKIEQETANYKIPVAFSLRESYPLPPYSTVIGMIHNLCNFEEYKKMKLSICGRHYSKFYDMFTRYEFSPENRFEEKRHQLIVNGYGITKGIGTTEVLVNVELIIHIVPEDDTLLSVIETALKFPKEYPSLGRREDLAIIREVKIVDIEKVMLEKSLRLKDELKNYSYYIPTNYVNAIKFRNKLEEYSIVGTYYDLNKNYILEKFGKNKFYRKWKKVKVLYSSNILSLLKGYEFLIDQDENPVFLV
ncbi:type I-B CRISPR-associated protein Cas5b [Thermosipho atlanticus]|uniref:CRISPR-associated protein Cas5t n=1 Tax=Thermosipho atlanticus DSM 15807 TaxID=1123380 RepID=A0A1M5U4W7_9BACT|nr:type I-B CRISPR-associated protein Cas5b [Thermosipho atlanticus]SHH57733.1 CRISPR-associated protein Cas5t [Thermosipho atlanticus DSM 15807]